VLRIVNLAHGELVIGAAYLSFAFTSASGLDPLVTLPVVMLVMAVLGVVLHRALLGPMTRRGSDGPLVATFGLALLAQGALTFFFTSDPKVVHSSYSTSGMSVLGVRVQLSYVIAFAVALVLAAAVHLMLTRTRWGAAVRASAVDQQVLSLLGTDVRRLQALVFGLATALAAAGGVMVGISLSFTPTSGPQFLVLGFAVVVLGGLGNVAGSLVAAVLLGIVQSLTAFTFGGGWRDVALYVVFLALVAWRPTGLLIRRRALA
jgi:branched-chain amino acid transport system permease protein